MGYPGWMDSTMALLKSFETFQVQETDVNLMSAVELICGQPGFGISFLQHQCNLGSLLYPFLTF